VRDWSNCQRCRLAFTRKRVAIIREGGEPGHTKLLFIGEAPGELEDATGYPFVGIAGKILDGILEFVPYQFEYIITNRVGCRPVDVYFLDNKIEIEDIDFNNLKEGFDYVLDNYNRDPTTPEIKACERHIDEIISTFNPDGIVCLGKIAATYETRLPKLKLLHPAFIARMEYKLITTLHEARKLTEFIERVMK